LIAAYTAANPQMWTSPLGMSFAIVVLGGLGSIKGSLVGAFIIGYAEKAVTIWTGMAYLEGAASLAVMVAVLLIKPAGLFGKRREMEE
jgi:branched-chain amino acid transport system permease protein